MTIDFCFFILDVILIAFKKGITRISFYFLFLKSLIVEYTITFKDNDINKETLIYLKLGINSKLFKSPNWVK